MKISLSWDLVIIFYLTVSITYSFINGKDDTLKLMLSNYIALLSADALWNLFDKFVVWYAPIADMIPVSPYSVLIVKLSLFILFMIVVSLKWWFKINLPKEKTYIEILITLLFWFLNASLVIAWVLVFASWASFIAWWVDIANSSIADMYNSSSFIQFIVLNYDLFFSLPAIAFVVMSILRPIND